jgi:hypothetical protein
MAATVFISHSCKDFGRDPRAGLSEKDAKLRALRLKFCRKLRDTLAAALKKDKRFKVFLDVRGGLRAGDVWRSGLHDALRTCSAGIVLLTPESLESRWVLKEATILSWRAFMAEPMVLVPIVLDVSRAQLEERGFGALDLDAIQWLKVNGTDEAEIERVVKEAADVLRQKYKSLHAGPRDLTDTEAWIETLATTLGNAIGATTINLNNRYLLGMCRELEIEPTDAKRFNSNPLVHVAAHVLLADWEQIIRFLRHVGNPSGPQRQELQQAVAALWVDPASAAWMLSKDAKVVAIDTAETASAREYIARSFCNRFPADRLIQPSDVTGGTEGDVLAEIKKCLGQVLPIEDAAALALDLEKNGRVYVVLGPGSTRPSVLDLVTRDYPQFTFVVAAGADPKAKLGAWSEKALVLRPLLQPARERAAELFRNRLAMFAKGT